MPDGLDVIIVDDDPEICELVSSIISQFYTWGEVFSFQHHDKATQYCLGREIGVAIFVIDVFLGEISGFSFLDNIEEKFPTVHSDAIIITGNASNDIVDMCVASNVNHLLEKPIKPYALQMAVRAIAEKYLKFAKKLFLDRNFAKSIAHF
jgi:response regulator of citrate/malate metabolism